MTVENGADDDIGEPTGIDAGEYKEISDNECMFSHKEFS